MTSILEVKAAEVLDSRGNPTLAVEVVLASGARGRAMVPSGASTGTHEAHELRDGGSRYGGKGTRQAAHQVNAQIAPEVLGMDACDQVALDACLIDLDGTPNKKRLGANAVLGVSLATARAASEDLDLPLYAYLGGLVADLLPVPLLNVINGGKHADNPLAIQEFMIVPAGAASYAEGLEMAADTYRALKAMLKQRGLGTGVGDEGGFAPELRDDEEAVELLLAAISKVGLTPGKEMSLALDLAANELKTEGGYRVRGEVLSEEGLIDLLARWTEAYPIVSLEDALAEDDWDGWQELTKRLGGRVQLVGDDLFVTQSARLQKGIDAGAANAILVKLNQVGTLTETLATMRLAQGAGFRSVVSHRSGETSDAFISDLAVATGAGQIKAGAPARGERVAKYNRLLEIEADLAQPRYAGSLVFPKGAW